MAKTYIPQLRAVANIAHRYSTRWENKLQASMTPTQYTALSNWIAATIALIQALGEPPVNP